MSRKTRQTRAPKAFSSDDPSIVSREKPTPEPEVLEIAPAEGSSQVPVASANDLSRGLKWGSFLVTAIGGLLLLAAGLWFNEFVTGLLAREDWIGWLSIGLLALALFSAAMIAASEIFALFRLRKLGRLHQEADSALHRDDKPLARQVAASIKSLYRSRADLAWNRARFEEHERDIMNARETLTLTERELLLPLDARARTIVADTAKRISVITAVSPLAVLDMAVVAVQNLRMLRQLAALYGARPGTLGLFRLARMVIGHIVLTGGLALGDDLIQQLIGHRMVAKLSARLGEGLFNGALTARIGLAAIDVCRPLPFVEANPPRFRDLLTELARQLLSREQEDDKAKA